MSVLKFTGSRRPVRLIAVAGLAVVLTTAIIAGCSSQAKVVAPVRPAVVEKAVPARMQGLETYAGEIRARYESVLAFRLGGKVESRKVDVGARVSKGDVLAVIEPDDFELASSAARAQVAWATADLSLANAELERHKTMLEKNYISQALYDARVNQFKAAEARLEQSQSALRQAENQTRYTRLVADHDGVITAINIEAGQVVAAGQPAVRLAHDGEVEVLINVPESRVAAFTPKQRVITEIWAEKNARYDGVVREIAPEADPRTRTYDVRVTLADSKSVQLGMTARVFLQGAVEKPALLVPLSALHELHGQPALWILDKQTRQVRLTPITVGMYGESGVTVLDGLAEDAWVVTAGVHKLLDGQSVRPIDRANNPVAI